MKRISNRLPNTTFEPIIRGLAIVFSILELIQKVKNLFVGLFVSRSTNFGWISNLGKYYRNIKREIVVELRY
jgi:hypothetical protein